MDSDTLFLLASIAAIGVLLWLLCKYLCNKD